MSEATLLTILIALIAAVPPTLAAFALWLQGRVLNTKMDGVHILVNSNLQDVKRELAAATMRIAELQALVTALQAKTGHRMK